jgi:hypothetical protein
MGYRTTRRQLKAIAERKKQKSHIEPPKDIATMLVEKYGATESVTYDEETGEPHRSFKIKL